ncbi:hypothetical protein GCM10028793_05990 [Nocardiopsis oceani]
MISPRSVMYDSLSSTVSDTAGPFLSAVSTPSLPAGGPVMRVVQVTRVAAPACGTNEHAAPDRWGSRAAPPPASPMWPGGFFR